MADSILCPSCGHRYSKVISTRPSYRRGSLRRRRACFGCGFRWSTLEVGVDLVAEFEREVERKEKALEAPERREGLMGDTD